MRVIEKTDDVSRVRFDSVSKGENFYYRDRLWMKCQTHLVGNTMSEASRMMTNFAVRLEDGVGCSFANEALVVPAKAMVTVELFGRFS